MARPRRGGLRTDAQARTADAPDRHPFADTAAKFLRYLEHDRAIRILDAGQLPLDRLGAPRGVGVLLGTNRDQVHRSTVRTDNSLQRPAVPNATRADKSGHLVPSCAQGISFTTQSVPMSVVDMGGSSQFSRPLPPGTPTCVIDVRVGKGVVDREFSNAPSTVDTPPDAAY